jgi:hypothetical protein
MAHDPSQGWWTHFSPQVIGSGCAMSTSSFDIYFLQMWLDRLKADRAVARQLIRPLPDHRADHPDAPRSVRCSGTSRSQPCPRRKSHCTWRTPGRGNSLHRIPQDSGSSPGDRTSTLSGGYADCRFRSAYGRGLRRTCSLDHRPNNIGRPCLGCSLRCNRLGRAARRFDNWPSTVPCRHQDTPGTVSTRVRRIDRRRFLPWS